MISTAPVLTSAGMALQLRTLMGDTINFTRFKIGNGKIDSTSEIPNLTDLVNPQLEFGISEMTKKDNCVILKGTFSSADIETSFVWRELGVFCQGEGDSEVLYGYANDGASAGTLTKLGSDVTSEQTVEMVIIVDNTEHVTATISDSAVYATKEELSNHTGDRSNPHGVTAAQVGLGNVPNVSTNDQTPTYPDNQSLSNLQSGETMQTAFGKIRTAVANLITHLSDKVIHITAAERSTWNGKAEAKHEHSASDISSGTLPVNRGGTGASMACDARTNLSVPSNGCFLPSKGACVPEATSGTIVLPVNTSSYNVAFQYGNSVQLLMQFDVTIAAKISATLPYKCYAPSFLPIVANDGSCVGQAMLFSNWLVSTGTIPVKEGVRIFGTYMTSGYVVS